ncbi:hypothetical protein MMC13_004272 [Lambiella insularis]|nr:hypothetical protein [Lambiella insularis]
MESTIIVNTVFASSVFLIRKKSKYIVRHPSLESIKTPEGSNVVRPTKAMLSSSYIPGQRSHEDNPMLSPHERGWPDVHKVAGLSAASASRDTIRKQSEWETDGLADSSDWEYVSLRPLPMELRSIVNLSLLAFDSLKCGGSLLQNTSRIKHRHLYQGI